MSTSTQERKKLDPNLSWLFALAAVAGALVVTLALNPLRPGSWKIIGGVALALSGGLAGASTLLTSARTGGVIGRFALGAVVVGGFFFWYTKHLLAAGIQGAADALHGTVTGDVGGFTSAGGTIVAVFVMIAMLMAAVAGAVIGSRLRAGKGYGLIPARR